MPIVAKAGSPHGVAQGRVGECQRGALTATAHDGRNPSPLDLCVRVIAKLNPALRPVRPLVRVPDCRD